MTIQCLFKALSFYQFISLLFFYDARIIIVLQDLLLQGDTNMLLLEVTEGAQVITQGNFELIT